MSAFQKDGQEDGFPSRPCIGSGYCCKTALCVLGIQVHGVMEGPCPSLVFENDRHWCGEVLKKEGKEKECLKNRLYIGEGCCSPLNSDRRDMLVKLKLRQSESTSS